MTTFGRNFLDKTEVMVVTGRKWVAQNGRIKAIFKCTIWLGVSQLTITKDGV